MTAGWLNFIILKEDLLVYVIINQTNMSRAYKQSQQQPIKPKFDTRPY